VTAHATENGLGEYPVGVNTVLNAVMPMPGESQFYNYSQYYSASKFAGPQGHNAIPDFHTDVLVDAARVMHTWGELFGPLVLVSGATLPVFHLHVQAGGSSGNRTDLGDLTVHAIAIGYFRPQQGLFDLLGVDVGLPTGAYSAARLANAGLHYYSAMPYFSETWMPTPRWEISSTTLVQMSSTNHTTGYHSGVLATFDYVIGYSITEKTQLGLQGYFLKQLTDDTVRGVEVADGFRGQAIGIGPQLRYSWSPLAAVALKVQREFAVRNRTQGERLRVEISFPLH
jgi:hypothetical protein